MLSLDHALRRHYTVFDGLAGMQVEDIAQDRRGFIWIATADGGLSRFDGIHFDNLTLKNGLPHPTIMSIAEDKDGRLWFGTLGGGISIYDGESFKSITVEQGLPSDKILGLRLEPDCSMLTFTEEGISRFENDRCIETITQIAGKPIGRVYDMKTDQAGITWLASADRGVISLDGVRLSWIDEAGNEAMHTPWKLTEDKRGHMWIATQYAGTDVQLYRYDPFTKKVDREKICTDAEGQVVEQGVRHIRMDNRGWLWAIHRGILVYDGTDWIRFSIGLTDSDYSDIRLTFEDREGNIWIGLWGGGLIFCDPVSVHRFTEQDGLPDREITGLTQDGDGRIWIGTVGGLACMTDRVISTPESRHRSTIKTLEVDRAGHVWFGSEDKNLYKWDGSTVKAIPITANYRNRVCSLYHHSDGSLWVGTAEGCFGKMDKETFVPIEAPLPCDVNVILCGQDGTFWMGAHGYTPALYHYDGREIKATTDPVFENISYINALCQTGDGTLWIGTGVGLFSIEHDTQKIRHFTIDDGLSENAISALAVDKEDGLWIGTNGGGAVHYDGHVFHIIRLGDSAHENKVESILCADDGQVWLGTRSGLVAYCPGSMPPGIVIRQVVTGRVFWEPSSVTIQEDTPEIRIEFQGISLRSNSRHMRYSHRLIKSGQDAEWSEFSPLNEVFYQNLPPGKYRFQVKAVDRDGLCSEAAELKLAIKVNVQKDHIQSLEKVLLNSKHVLIGESDEMQETLEQASKVADTDMTVLLLAETGAGKGLIARTIHEISNRRDMPFIQLNCGAIPEGLVESELFGHEKGAFTGAATRKIGRFELAHKGTLFLDEIGDLPLGSQRVLLHILEENSLVRVGGVESVPIDVRVIAATNRDLKAAIEEGSFREDLFYRLGVITIGIPPLRKRQEDIPLLVHYFIEDFARHLNRPISKISAEIMKYLQNYSWPGNVRELEHLIQRAVLLCDSNTIQKKDLPLLATQSENASESQPETETKSAIFTTIDEQEKQLLEKALKTTNWVVYGGRGAAKLLHMNPERLRSRMRVHGLKKPAREPASAEN